MDVYQRGDLWRSIGYKLKANAWGRRWRSMIENDGFSLYSSPFHIQFSILRNRRLAHSHSLKWLHLINQYTLLFEVHSFQKNWRMKSLIYFFQLYCANVQLQIISPPTPSSTYFPSLFPSVLLSFLSSSCSASLNGVIRNDRWKWSWMVERRKEATCWIGKEKSEDWMGLIIDSISISLECLSCLLPSQYPLNDPHYMS